MNDQIELSFDAFNWIGGILYFIKTSSNKYRVATDYPEANSVLFLCKKIQRRTVIIMLGKCYIFLHTKKLPFTTNSGKFYCHRKGRGNKGRSYFSSTKHKEITNNNFSVEHCTVTKLNHYKEIGQCIATFRQNGLFLFILHVQGMQFHTKPKLALIKWELKLHSLGNTA